MIYYKTNDEMFNFSDVLFSCSTGLGDYINTNGAVTYLSKLFTVHLVVPENYYNQLQEMYNDNKNVKFIISTSSRINIHHIMRQFFPYGAFVFLSGAYKSFVDDSWNDSEDVKLYPKNFYRDMEIPFSIHKYFRLGDIEYLEPPNVPYIFIHEKWSGGQVDIFNTLNTDLLVIDPNTNHYDPSHPFYSIAQTYVEPPSIFRLVRVIENAQEIHMVESSILCLALFLQLDNVKVKKCHVKRSELLNNVDSNGFTLSSSVLDQTESSRPNQDPSTSCYPPNT